VSKKKSNYKGPVFKGFKLDKHRQTGVEVLQIIYHDGKQLKYFGFKTKRGTPLPVMAVHLMSLGSQLIGGMTFRQRLRAAWVMVFN